MVLERLFSPGYIGNMKLKNRIVMAPMGTNLANPDGSISESLISYYEARAKGGTGLIIAEITTPDERARTKPFPTGIWSDSHIPGWRELAHAVHAHGTKIAVQLGHRGRQQTAAIQGEQPVAPSPIPCPVIREVPRELTIADIEELIEKFAQGARRLKEAGIDAVELHGAHGYLIGEFMSPYFNKRADSYGGDMMGRLKFPLEMIKRVREEVGPDYPLIFRLNAVDGAPGGIDLSESKRMAPIIVAAGVDAVDVSVGVYGGSLFINPPMGFPYGLYAHYAQAIKEAVTVPVIGVGRINDPRLAEEILEMRQADFIALGRSLLADPDLPNKAEAGNFEDIRPCIGCTQGCLARSSFGGEPTLACTCMLNPTIGRERAMTIGKAEQQRTIFIAGGGPAGLESARVAAERGHKVVLYEKSDRLGGQLNIAAIPPFKQEVTLAIKYYTNQLSKLGVRVELGKELTVEAVESLKPDIVILATGGSPYVASNIPGINNKNVVLANDLLLGKTAVGNKVVIVGGGFVGCETADFLGERGHQITILEMREDIGLDIAGTYKVALMRRLTHQGIRKVTSATLVGITDDGVVIKKDGREETISGIDSVVLAMGVSPVNELSEKLKDKRAEVYVIGDASKPGNALTAIAESTQLARKL